MEQSYDISNNVPQTLSCSSFSKNTTATSTTLDKPTNTQYYKSELEKKSSMNIRPSLEGRVTVQERRQIDLEARIEDLYDDMKAGYNQFSKYCGLIEDQLHKNATDIAEMKVDIATMKGDIVTMTGDISKIEGRLDKMETDITEIKSKMAKNHQETARALIQILDSLPKTGQ